MRDAWCAARALRALGFLLAVGLCSSPGHGAAHELDTDQLTLWPEPASATLRGQFTCSPHRIAKRSALEPAELDRAITASLERAFKLELDGRACRPSYEVREHWVRAGAALGDIVMLRCELPAGARSLRVFVGKALGRVVVTVQAPQPSGAVVSQSASVAPGHWSPRYHFGADSPGWHEGGANQSFAPRPRGL